MSQNGMVQVARLAHLKTCPLRCANIGALPVAPWPNCGLPAAPQQLRQPCPLPQSTSIASPKRDPSYNFLVDSGVPQSLPRSLFVAGGFWAVILTRPAWARHWAQCGLVEACGFGRVLCLNRWYSMGPACNSLDHRARGCYLQCSLMYNELHHAIGMCSLLVPPSAF